MFLLYLQHIPIRRWYNMKLAKKVKLPVQSGPLTLWHVAWNPGPICLSSTIFISGTITFLWYFDFLFGPQLIKGKKLFKLFRDIILYVHALCILLFIFRIYSLKQCFSVCSEEFICLVFFLKTTEIYCLKSSEAKSLESKCGQGSL